MRLLPTQMSEPESEFVMENNLSCRKILVVGVLQQFKMITYIEDVLVNCLTQIISVVKLCATFTKLNKLVQ